jgi:hypothetical protein
MYSYIYADRALNYFVGSKTTDGINKAALDYIKNMAGYELPPHASRAHKEVFAAIQKQDVQAAIEAWNYYARTELNYTVACHKIEPLVIVE